jgi:hypothetical protein
MVTSNKRMQDFLADEYDGQKEDRKVNSKSGEILRMLRDEVEEKIQVTESVSIESYATRTVNMCWKQILAMLEQVEAAIYT